MFTTQFGLFWIFLLCRCNESEGKIFLEKRTSVALAGKAVVHHLTVTIPANSTKSYITCYKNSHKVWTYPIDQNISSEEQKKLTATITMHNSSCSGEYYFKYMNEKLYWVVLVRDVGYLPDVESSVVPLLVVVIILLLLSITGSVYFFKWYKNYLPSKEDGDEVKAKKRKSNTVVTEEGATSDSVYTALEQRTVSVYDVLNVDKDRRASTEGQTSKEKANPSPAEEGIFELVYENL